LKGGVTNNFVVLSIMFACKKRAKSYYYFTSLNIKWLAQL